MRCSHCEVEKVEGQDVFEEVSAIFFNPGSLFVTPLWFKAVANRKDGTLGWYWTPYAQHKAHNWQPVTESTAPSGIYQGQVPAKKNMGIIQCLCDNESETAAKALDHVFGAPIDVLEAKQAQPS